MTFFIFPNLGVLGMLLESHGLTVFLWFHDIELEGQLAANMQVVI